MFVVNGASGKTETPHSQRGLPRVHRYAILIYTFPSTSRIPKPMHALPPSHLLPLLEFRLVTRHLPHRAPQHPRIDTTVPPHLALFDLDIRSRPLRGDGLLVPEDEQVVVFAVEAIDVLESAVGGLRVEEVDDGQEGEVEDDPDDVETPAEGLDADRGDFDDCGREIRVSLHCCGYLYDLETSRWRPPPHQSAGAEIYP